MTRFSKNPTDFMHRSFSVDELNEGPTTTALQEQNYEVFKDLHRKGRR